MRIITPYSYLEQLTTYICALRKVLGETLHYLFSEDHFRKQHVNPWFRIPNSAHFAAEARSRLCETLSWQLSRKVPDLGTWQCARPQSPIFHSQTNFLARADDRLPLAGPNSTKETLPNLNAATDLLFKRHAEYQQFQRRRGGKHACNTTFCKWFGFSVPCGVGATIF